MDEAELLAAIDDPASRAVYADWLEQRGDPRAELVRIAHDAWAEPIDLLRVRRLFGRRREIAGVGDAEWRRRITLPTTAELRRRVGVLAAFGHKKQHDWKLAAPLGADDVAAVEQRLGVALPAQYRRYLTELSDGGAGPDYGILPIKEAMGCAGCPASARSPSSACPRRSGDCRSAISTCSTAGWSSCRRRSPTSRSRSC